MGRARPLRKKPCLRRKPSQKPGQKRVYPSNPSMRIQGKIRELRRRIDAARVKCITDGSSSSSFFNKTDYPYSSYIRKLSYCPFCGSQSNWLKEEEQKEEVQEEQEEEEEEEQEEEQEEEDEQEEDEYEYDQDEMDEEMDDAEYGNLDHGEDEGEEQEVGEEEEDAPQN
ncbi:uncharacterized protein LOC127011503 [Drosophila biarmipes]|uniref:uncharacterized protein LOC127011503 n=1 Tax=Drosophila biarmipes TaxID=125945 RepID=UPI0021CC8DE4|nr:uncharacterized protein LOC127011503 [Drosophila biarmipes]